MHRTGQHGVDRRCMTTDEMIVKGMSLNHKNFWIGSKMERFFEKEKT